MSLKNQCKSAFVCVRLQLLGNIILKTSPNIRCDTTDFWLAYAISNEICRIKIKINVSRIGVNDNCIHNWHYLMTLRWHQTWRCHVLVPSLTICPYPSIGGSAILRDLPQRGLRKFWQIGASNQGTLFLTLLSVLELYQSFVTASVSTASALKRIRLSPESARQNSYGKATPAKSVISQPMSWSARKTENQMFLHTLNWSIEASTQKRLKPLTAWSQHGLRCGIHHRNRNSFGSH